MNSGMPENDEHGLHLDELQLRKLSTTDLIRHALAEAQLLAKAEVLQAKHELKAELKQAKTAGILFGAAGVLALCGLSVLFVAIAAALGLSLAVSATIVGVVLLVASGILAFVGKKRLPTQPLARTQRRLKENVHLTREQLS